MLTNCSSMMSFKVLLLSLTSRVAVRATKLLPCAKQQNSSTADQLRYFKSQLPLFKKIKFFEKNLISHFNMDSQLILCQKLSLFECASKQHLVRGLHNPLSAHIAEPFPSLHFLRVSFNTNEDHTNPRSSRRLGCLQIRCGGDDDDDDLRHGKKQDGS